MGGVLDTIAATFSGDVPLDRLIDLALGAGGTIVHIFITLVVAFLLVKAGNALIDRLIVQRAIEDRRFMDDRKARTLRSLLKSLMRYAIYVFAGISILSELGVDTTGLLAGAGLAGIAIGFGAQNLVRDVINGFFILFEDQFAVGDYVTVGDAEGIVESIGLRTTSVRAFSGELHIVPNGQISKVTNHMGSAMRVMFSVTVDYRTDIDRAMEVLARDFERAKQEIPDIVDGPTVLGVNALGESGVDLLIIAKAKPMEQWHVERDLKKRIKEVFDREGIVIPYPHMEVLLGKAEKPPEA
ncbi:MAG: mechanosensitive ion channel family protein [Bacillota bacterium]|nr:mechanosensitive ion channel family protein [Bacillota bacterium]